MPSFDVVSEFDAHEASNAVDQANREVTTRFDFKGTGSKYTLEGDIISVNSQTDFQLKQMADILRQKLSKRGRPLIARISGKVWIYSSLSIMAVSPISEMLTRHCLKLALPSGISMAKARTCCR